MDTLKINLTAYKWRWAKAIFLSRRFFSILISTFVLYFSRSHFLSFCLFNWNDGELSNASCASYFSKKFTFRHSISLFAVIWAIPKMVIFPYMIVFAICQCRAPVFTIFMHIICAPMIGHIIQGERKDTWLATVFWIIAWDSNTFCNTRKHLIFHNFV